MKKELQIMCVLFTEDVGGILTLEFLEDGNLILNVDHEESDYLFEKSLGTDHLHAEKASALLLAKPAKSQVGNSRHWRQDEPVWDLHISDFPLHFLWKLI